MFHKSNQSALWRPHIQLPVFVASRNRHHQTRPAPDIQAGIDYVTHQPVEVNKK